MATWWDATTPNPLGTVLDAVSVRASNLWAVALYRKYRPATFAEVVGQEHVTDPLSTALDTGRISHAYLFSGPRGCGKTSSARILARSLNCVEGPTSTPCGVCSSCVALGPGGPGNLDVIELDAASHGGVDDTRELRDRAFYAPAESRYRVFIVDEAHMVTTAGFNALLKIVEEPPAHLIFVFATTEPDKVLPTIRSRTHHYPFRLLPPATMRGLLGRICDQEGVQVEESVYPLVIRAGGGSPRDSLSVLDQLLAGAGTEGVTYPRAVSLLGVTDIALIDDAIEALAADDGAALFGVIDRVVESGHDPRRFATDLLERLRDLILMRAVPDATERGLVSGPGDVIDRMRAQAHGIGPATLTRYAELLHEGLGEMRGATAPRLLLEVIAARMLLPSATDTESAALQRLERIERRIAGGALPPAAPAGTQPPTSQATSAAPAAEPRPAAPQPEAGGSSRRRGAEALAALRAEKTGTDAPQSAPQSAAPTPPQPAAPAQAAAPVQANATAAAGTALRPPELNPASVNAITPQPTSNSVGAQAGSVAPTAGAVGDFEKARETLLMLVGFASARAVTEPQWIEKLTAWAGRLHTLTPDNADAIRAVLAEDAPTLRELSGSAPAAAQSAPTVVPVVESPAPQADSVAEATSADEEVAVDNELDEVAEPVLAFAATDVASLIASSEQADANGDEPLGLSDPDGVEASVDMAESEIESTLDESVEQSEVAAEVESPPLAVDAEAVVAAGSVSKTVEDEVEAAQSLVVDVADEGLAVVADAAVDEVVAESADAGAEAVGAEPEPAAVGSGGVAVLQEVEGAWADIKAKLREFGPALPALLTAASVARVEGNTIVLAHQHAALAQRLSEPKNVEAVRSTVRAVLGREHDVRWEVGGAPQAGSAARGSAAGAAGGEGAAAKKKVAPKFSRPSQTKSAVAAPEVQAADTSGWGTPSAGSSAAVDSRGGESLGTSAPTPPDDDIPLPDGPDLPDDPGGSDYSPVGYDGVPPASTEEEEREMLAAAAQPVAPGDRRDPDEVALELLRSELGATPMEG